MIAERGLTIIELDRRASTQDQPVGIIAADCLNPREIDDGIFVEQLPAAQELYRVGVCVVDASKLFDNGDVFKQAMTNTRAEYWNESDGTRGYRPMIDEQIIRRLEFTAKHIRNALMVTFVVGAEQAPTDVDVKFGKVEVLKNMNYKRFDESCCYSERNKKFGRAAAFIMKHLQYTSGGDDDALFDVTQDSEHIYRKLVHVPSYRRSRVGSKINEAYMVAAGHVVADMMQRERRPAIYRVNDASDTAYLDFFPPNIARYSSTPGPHDGLNLPVYARVTSPLRRLEDFVMHRQLKLRALGNEATERDERVIAAAIQRLNGFVAAQMLDGPLRLSKQDTLGRTTAAERARKHYGAHVAALDRTEAASAEAV